MLRGCDCERPDIGWAYCVHDHTWNLFRDGRWLATVIDQDFAGRTVEQRKRWWQAQYFGR